MSSSKAAPNGAVIITRGFPIYTLYLFGRSSHLAAPKEAFVAAMRQKNYVQQADLVDGKEDHLRRQIDNSRYKKQLVAYAAQLRLKNKRRA